MQYKAFVPLMMLPPVENSVIQPLAENSKEAKSCNLLIMADSRALGQKLQTILMSTAKGKRTPLGMVKKSLLKYRRKSKETRRITWIALLATNLDSNMKPFT